MKSQEELLTLRKYKTTLPSKTFPTQLGGYQNILADIQREGRQYHNKHTHFLQKQFRKQHVIQDLKMKTESTTGYWKICISKSHRISYVSF